MGCSVTSSTNAIFLINLDPINKFIKRSNNKTVKPQYQHTSAQLAVADPEFPKGSTNPKVWTRTYYFANFPQKLHENEKKSGREGGTRDAGSLGSANAYQRTFQADLFYS